MSNEGDLVIGEKGIGRFNFEISQSQNFKMSCVELPNAQVSDTTGVQEKFKS